MSTKLATYLKRKNLSHRAFAARVGLPHLHPMVGLWAKGSRFPGIETAFAIEKGTEGEIPAAYWSALARQRRARHQRGEVGVSEATRPQRVKGSTKH